MHIIVCHEHENYDKFIIFVDTKIRVSVKVKMRVKMKVRMRVNVKMRVKVKDFNP